MKNEHPGLFILCDLDQFERYIDARADHGHGCSAR